MSAPKIAILFYSTYGTNYGVAQVAKAAAEAAGADVRLLRIPETAPEEAVQSQEAWVEQVRRVSDLPAVSHDDLLWADGIWLSAPTRFGGQTSQVRAWIDTLGPLWSKGGLVNKTVTSTTSAQNPNGGVEQTLLNFYTAAMHWGAIIVPPGYADGVKFEDGGNPYGYSKVAGELEEKGKASVEFQMKRFVEITGRIAG